MSFKLKFNCPENWDKMSDCGTNRFCQNCKQSVHDLSLVDEEEAIALVQGPEDTCVRFSVNKAGQVLTRTGFSTALIFSSSLTLGCWEGTDKTDLSNPVDTIETIEPLMGEPEDHVAPSEGTESTSGDKATEGCEDTENSATATEEDTKVTRPPRMGKPVMHRKDAQETPAPSGETN